MIKEIISYFDDDLKAVFSDIDSAILQRITEIRIRKQKPVAIVIRNTAYFIDYNGDLYDYVCHNAVIISSEEFDKLFLKLCDYSIYSSMENMKSGYITITNGARIGIAGTCVSDGKGIMSVKDIVSLNIRIPRSIEGSADKLLNSLYVNSFPSIIIAGKPNSGKTTLLRDLAYQLSNGFANHYSKITIVDERNEIAGKLKDDFSVNTGANCDILTGYSKARGIEIATRVLSPDMIICDEIATIEELKSIDYAFSSGVSFALSVHIGCLNDLKTRPVLRRLIEAREFEYIVLLEEYTYNIKIIDTAEVMCEINRSSDFNNSLYRDRYSSFI